MVFNDIDENYGSGYIKLFRSLRNHWIWNDPIKLRWWLDIILEVNHKPNKVDVKFDVIQCDRGQSVRSLEGWAKRWLIDKTTVNRFFKMLEKDGMITLENLKVTTRLTVCNYASYNDNRNANETQMKRNAFQFETGRMANKNDKNDKNDNKSINSDFEVFWSAYDKKVDKFKCQAKFDKLTKEEIEKILSVVKSYVESTPDTKYRKNPLTWLNGKCWNDVQKYNNSNGTQRKMVW